MPYTDVVNVSMEPGAHEVLEHLDRRCSSISILVIGAWGMSVALQEFALALLVGLIAGSYSSIFIATPILAALKEREPRYQELAARRTRSRTSPRYREQMAQDGAPARPKRPTGAATETIAQTSTPAAVLTHPPRPRRAALTGSLLAPVAAGSGG
ncbi:MAG: hypothetical protein R2705_18695 [Ilumatobacteraceae bacterium]